jgi:hypothetical protein
MMASEQLADIGLPSVSEFDGFNHGIATAILL